MEDSYDLAICREYQLNGSRIVHTKLEILRKLNRLRCIDNVNGDITSIGLPLMEQTDLKNICKMISVALIHLATKDNEDNLFAFIAAKLLAL